MAETHETITDIIAEKRRRADEIERDCAEKMKRGGMVSDCYARELVADIRREADRLEAALKRELAATTEKSSAIGDAAKWREALKALVGVIDKCDSGSPLWWHSGAKGVKPLKDARAALAAPPRNCDRPECATTKAAQNVWRKEDGGRTAYYEWLLAPATEKEGGEK